ncbi:MAG: UDP-N-acetylmuramate--L-alanine ligase [Butyrivibrio sp.]|jgi:UDP-N-acetylmuramate--alanine ligase|uniref:UDP-N-acetylmuramate--L-alanine ligase n=1 Tax=Butyrivibrio sp. TaxID=28121 RepID=UPI001EB5DADD|nr:UDP-N-acetylmuramate--L-alanine ligase [Butyrivibrio sp.]MBE5839769.1 UDP-N-acetylmuramate--L-alanine ligase [Butyrivibrio sp.]
MYTIDFDKPVHVYFMGIGGISMSGLASILIERNFKVSGSDSKKSAMTENLENQGVTILYGQKAENIDKMQPIDVVVYTAAVHPDNPEFVAAKNAGIPMLTRAELLGQIMKQYGLPIAISGTHGKTTTTSMLSKILLEADTDPTLSIGGVFKDIGGNIRVGKSEYFVTEACEYTNSFLSFFPKISVISNIDADHLDFFKDLDDIRHSFRKFAELLPADGSLIINGDIDNLSYITDGLKCSIITYGSTSDCDFYPTDITYDDHGNPAFKAHLKDGSVLDIKLAVPGIHNVYNALAAIAVSTILDIDKEHVVTALSLFGGTSRRFEYKGEIHGVTIIDDYAHHPTEIKATLTAAQNYPHGKIWCVFQPHTYTRTKALMNEFAEALSLADHVILADIYAARETDNLGISSRTLRDKIIELGHECNYFPTYENFAEIEKFLLQNCTKGDLLITMGAGDVVKIGNELLGQ